MAAFISGMALGCLIGVCGTYIVLLLAAVTPPTFPNLVTEFSALKVVVSSLVICAVGVTCFRLSLHKSVTALLLLLTIFIIARLLGIAIGLFSSVVAAALLSFLFLTPIGSLRISRPSDQFMLAVFLLSSLLGCRMIGRTRQIADHES